MSEDTLNTCYYQVDVFRLSNDANLASIAVAGVSSGGVSSSLDVSLSPSFSLSTNTYTLSVPNSIQSLTINVGPSNPSATVVYYRDSTSMRVLAQTPTSVSLPINTVSGLIALAPGLTYVTIRTTSGDLSAQTVYTITITRVSDLLSVSLTGLPDGVAVPTMPIFSPGQPVLKASVQYKVEQYCMATTHTTANAGWVVSATGVTAAQTVSLPASGPTCSSVLSLASGEKNTFLLTDPVDPVGIAVEVTRALPVITTLVPSVTDGAAYFTAPVTFKSNLRSYVGSTAFISSTAQLLAHFSAGSALVSITGNAAFQSIPLLSDVALIVPLAVGSNTIVITHSSDGIYTYVLTRAVPDVTMIRVDGQLADLSPRNGLTISPVFAGGDMGYTGTVTSVVRKISFLVTFSTLNTMSYTHTLTNGNVPATVNSGVETALLTLVTGTSTFSFNSLRDGLYVLEITQGTGDVGGIILTGKHWDGSNVIMTLSPSFTPGVLTQRTASVPKAILSYTVTPSFNTAGTMTLTRPSTADIALTTATATSQLVLAVGANTLTVVSVADGSYPFTITRAPADVSLVSFTGISQEGTARTLTLSPALFSVNTRSYSMYVPYRTQQVTMQSSFLTPGSVTIQGGAQATPLSLVTVTDTVPIGISVGVNTFSLTSALDGAYTYTVTRAAPDVTSIAWTLQSTTAATWTSAPASFQNTLYTYSGTAVYSVQTITVKAVFASVSSLTVSVSGDDPLTLTSNVNRAIPLPVGATQLVFTSVTDGIYVLDLTKLGVDVTSLNVNGYSIASLELFPPSIPDELTPVFDPLVSAFTLTVAASVRKVTFTAGWATASNTLQVTDPSSVVTSLANNVESTSLAISAGDNTFFVDSLADGRYKIVITQLQQDLIGVFPTDFNGIFPGVVETVPKFTAGVHEYDLFVPYVVQFLTFTLETMHSDSGLTLSRASSQFSASAVVPATDGSGYLSSFNRAVLDESVTGLMPAPNRLTVTSLYDENFYFTVYRSPHDATSWSLKIQTLGDDVNGQTTIQTIPSPVILTSTNLSPEWNPIAYVHRMELPFTATGLSLAVIFATAGTYSYGLDSSAQLELLAAGVFSSYVPLSVGNQSLSAISTLDGQYHITVTRAPAEVSNIGVRTAWRTCDQTSSSACAPVNQPLNRPFTQATVASDLHYSVSVPHVVGQVQLTSSFVTPMSMTLLDDTNTYLQTMLSGAWSPWHQLRDPLNPTATAAGQTTLTELRLSSTQDGLYLVDVLRALPDLQYLVMKVESVACPAASSSLIGRVLVAPDGFFPAQDAMFLPMIYSYPVSVAYAVKTITIETRFLQQWPSNVVSLRQINSRLTDTTVFIPLRSDQVVTDVVLEVGTNVFTFDSAADGTYTVTITRAGPTITDLEFFGLSASAGTGQQALSTNFALTPPFQTGVYDYTVTIPAAVNQISWSVSSNDATDVITLENTDDTTTQTITAGVTFTTPITTLTGPAAQMHYTLFAQNDGCYTITISHAAVAALQSVLWNQVDDFGENLEAAATAFAAVSAKGGLTDAAADVYSSTFDQVTLASPSLPGVLVDPVTGMITRPLSISPAFIAGWRGPYVARVRSDQTFALFNFGLDSAMLSAPSCNLNFQPFKLQTTITPECQSTDPSITLQPGCATQIPLISGLNTLECVTDDGTYQFVIERGQGQIDQSAFQMPSYIYANELVSGLQLTASGLSATSPTPATDLTLSFVASLGSTVSPSVWPFTTSAAASVSLRGPTSVVSETSAYVSYIVTGSTAWAYPLPPITKVQVKPQAHVLVKGLAASYYSLQPSVDVGPIYVSLTDSPNPGASLTVTVEMVDFATGTLAIPQPVAVLTFTAATAGAQAIHFITPLQTSSSRQTILRVTLSGSDLRHYAPLASDYQNTIKFTLTQQSSFYLNNLPASLYVSKSIPLSLSPAQAPSTDVQVKVTVSQYGTIGLGAIDAGSNQVTSVSVPFSTTMTLHFPAFSSAAQPFVYSAPLNFVGDGTFTLDFKMTGADSDHYLAIASSQSTILHAVTCSITNAPATLLNREQSGVDHSHDRCCAAIGCHLHVHDNAR